MEINKEVLQACIDGDRKSQSMLYELSFSSLMSIAIRYRINREDAVDLVNQAFLKILNGLSAHKNINQSNSYFAWIHKIMSRTIIDEFRKNKIHNEKTHYIDNSIYLEQLSDGDYNYIEDTIEEEALQEMLNNLSESQRNVFNLFAIEGLSHKKIAHVLSISVDNSKWHLSQARKRLQLILKKQLENIKINQSE
jgi:RNA polymerase sigma-70 factor (ECF subfamily)